MNIVTEKRKRQKASASRRDYARNMPARKAAQAVYRSKPENRELATCRARTARLKNVYGLTGIEFDRLLTRQFNRCACCAASFDKEKACVDHDHATGRVRGLVCRACNVGLGMAKDSRATLYQMAAYLELDRSRPVVYLIGSLRNPKVLALGNEIRALGIECIDNWMAAGPTADDSWLAYSNIRGRSYKEALESREARHVFYFDRAYLNLADAVVFLSPAGKSGHLEFGYAIGQGKRGYMLMEEPSDRYDVMLQFANASLFHDQPSLLAAMREELLGGKAHG